MAVVRGLHCTSSRGLRWQPISKAMAALRTPRSSSAFIGCAQGNLFTYTSGPQMKCRAGKFAPLCRSTARRCPHQLLRLRLPYATGETPEIGDYVKNQGTMGHRDRSSRNDHEARISYVVDYNDDLGENNCGDVLLQRPDRSHGDSEKMICSTTRRKQPRTPSIHTSRNK